VGSEAVTARRDDHLPLLNELTAPGWFDQPPEELGPEPVERVSDRLLTVLGMALLLVTVVVIVWLVLIAGQAQGTWSG
jgi:hypothetical protein